MLVPVSNACSHKCSNRRAFATSHDANAQPAPHCSAIYVQTITHSI